MVIAAYRKGYVMSKEKAKQFLKEYRDNEEAMKILKQFPEPKTDEEAISCFVEAAGKIGLQITEEEMAEAARELKEERKAKTDASIDDMRTLDIGDLEDVAGGIYYLSPYGERIYAGCYGDFTDDNCFNTDACNKVNIYYYDCKYTFHPEGDEYNCTWNEANPFKKG